MTAALPSKYSFKLPRNQSFSFPFPIISYITETPSSFKGLQKLKQTCKYFFAKKRILVVNESIHYGINGFGYNKDLFNYVKLPLGKIQYWFTILSQNQWFHNNNTSFSALRPHIYRLKLECFKIYLVDLSLNEINFILSTNKLNELHLVRVNIRDKNGNPILFDYILSKIPLIRKLYYDNRCEIYSNESFIRLSSINLIYKLDVFDFVMFQASEEINAQIFNQFLEKIMARFSSFSFEIQTNLSELLRPVRSNLYQIRKKLDMK